MVTGDNAGSMYPKPEEDRNIKNSPTRSRDRIHNKENYHSLDPIKSTRLDDVLATPEAAPPPPARTDSRDIKDILATHRSRPRRPFYDTRKENGTVPPVVGKEDLSDVSRTPPMSPPPTSPSPASPSATSPPPSKDSRSNNNVDNDVDNVLEKLRKRKERLLNNKPDKIDRKPADRVPDRAPDKVPNRAPERPNHVEVMPSPPNSAGLRPKTPMSPPDDLERQTLDSLEGLTSTIIKERDQARKERQEARSKCEAILQDYDGRRQVWQNQLNVVKIRLEHYAKRHDRLRNDILKQREQFDVERARMKERHAAQIEGLFGDLFKKIKSDTTYVGSTTGLDEVNYKLQAFMELWKGLAHDVDDLYDKEHYCLRLCETTKQLQEQIKHQNKVIAMLLKGQPVEGISIPPTPTKTQAPDLPPPNINVTVDDHKWEIIVPEKTFPSNTELPEFEEIKTLGSLLPKEDGLSVDDILKQFGPIEDTLNSVSLSLGPKKKDTRSKKIDDPPIIVKVDDLPLKKSEPIPRPSINLDKEIKRHNKKPDLPIEMDPKVINNAKRNRPSRPIETQTNPVPLETNSLHLETDPITMETTFDEPAIVPDLAHQIRSAAPLKETSVDEPTSFLPKEPKHQPSKETLIDDPAPKKKKKKPKKKEEEPIYSLPPDQLQVTPSSPTSSFRRRRASLESAKDFSVLDDGEYPMSPTLNPRANGNHPLSPFSQPKVPKETLLDDPARPRPPSVSSAPKSQTPSIGSMPLSDAPKPKKRWTPSMPIFGKKPTKSAPPQPAPEPARTEPSVTEEEPTTSTSTTDKSSVQAPVPPARPMKRAKSLPRFRDPSLPRNMASHNMKRAKSNPRLRQGPGSEYNSDDSDSDSDIRSLMESVYVPLHLTPSRANSRRNVREDDAKSECSSFARRNKMPASMGWLDTNKADTSDDSSEEETSEEDSEEEDSEEEEDSDFTEEEDSEEIDEEADTDKQSEDDMLPDIVPAPLPAESEDYRNSMLSSILKDFDQGWPSSLNSSTNNNPDQSQEMLI